MMPFLALALQAADPVAVTGEMSCPVVEQGLTIERIDAILPGTTAAAAEQSQVEQAMRAALLKCAAAHGWSDNRFSAAAFSLYTEAMIRRNRARYEALGAPMVSYDKLHGYFATLGFDDQIGTLKGVPPYIDRLEAFFNANGSGPTVVGRARFNRNIEVVAELMVAWTLYGEARLAFAQDRGMRDLGIGKR